MPLPAGVPIVWPSAIALSTTSASATTKWIQVAKTGKFFSTRYGKFEISRGDLSTMLRNFRTITPIAPTQLPVDYDHLSMDPKTPGDGKAAGWFSGPMELRAGGEELWAEVEFTAPASESIRNKEYRFVSPSFVKEYVWKNGENIGTTLIAAAITNHPFLEGMQAVTLSHGLGEMAISLADQTPPSPPHAGPPAPPKAAPNAGGIKMEVGQHVAIKDEFLTNPAWKGQTFEIAEVAGVGDDAFAKLKALAAAAAPVVAAVPGAPVAAAAAIPGAPPVAAPVVAAPAAAPAAAMPGWYRVSELDPAPAAAAANPAGAPNPFAAHPGAAAPVHMSSEDSMSVFKLRDARGQETDVNADDLQKFIDEQVAAKSGTPAGSVLISASQVAEFQSAATQVASLQNEVKNLNAQNEVVRQANHVITLTARLDSLKGKITKPERDWALKTFGDPVALSAFEEWEKVTAGRPMLVSLNTEHGTSVGADAPEPRPDGQLLVLANARAKEKNISLREAIHEVSTERKDLSTSYLNAITNDEKKQRAIH